LSFVEAAFAKRYGEPRVDDLLVDFGWWLPGN
jgi:hypothetical protein